MVKASIVIFILACFVGGFSSFMMAIFLYKRKNIKLHQLLGFTLTPFKHLKDYYNISKNEGKYGIWLRLFIFSLFLLPICVLLMIIGD